MKPKAEPKLKVAVESEQAVRILSAMSRVYNKAASGSSAKAAIGKEVAKIRSESQQLC